MTRKIRELLDSKVRETENLKKAELKALQAQINPHFLLQYPGYHLSGWLKPIKPIR